MPTVTIRYALDPTGMNPDNLVAGEVHTLSTARNRAVAIKYGAFFTTNFVVRDHLTNNVLTKGTDYHFVELLQEATLKFGKEIYLGLVVVNEAVSGQIRLTYQVLGGLYQNPSESIKNAYENLEYHGPIEWVNVLHKPIEYPPSLHHHLMTDVQGYEALNVALERIRNAIVLSNVPAFDALIEWVKSRTLDPISPGELSNYSSSGFTKGITFERLLQAAREYSFNTITITPSKTAIDNNETISVNVRTTNIEDNVNLFWTIQHINTSDADFATTSGNITIIGHQAIFNIGTSVIAGSEPNESFKIVIRKNGILGPELAKSAAITIRGVDVPNDEFLYGKWLYHPEVSIDAESYYLVGAGSSF